MSDKFLPVGGQQAMTDLLDEFLTRLHGEDWTIRDVCPSGLGTFQEADAETIDDAKVSLIAVQDALIRKLVGR